MSIDALAGRVKKIALGKGKQSTTKMLIFYYALKAANLLKLAAYSLGMIKLMDLALFHELSLDIGMSITALQNNVIKNESNLVDCIHTEIQNTDNMNNIGTTNDSSNVNSKKNINIMNNMNEVKKMI
jgi:hypothetical protein